MSCYLKIGVAFPYKRRKGEGVRLYLSKKKERFPFAFIVEKERFPFAFIVEKGEVYVCLYRRKRRGVRLPLSQKKEQCRVAFYAKKRSYRVALPFTPRKGVVVSCLGYSSRKEEYPKSF